MSILNYAIVVRIDVQIDIGQLRRSAATKARHRNHFDTIAFRPIYRADNVLRITRRADCDQYISRLGQTAQLEGKDLIVGNIVADSGDDFHRRTQRDNAGLQSSICSNQLTVIADKVVGYCCRTTIATRINYSPPRNRLVS